MIKDIKDTEKRYDIKTASRGENISLDKIYQGDAYELIRQIPDKSIDLIVTDPPYQIEGLNGKSGIFKWCKMSYVNELKVSTLSKGIDGSILDEYLRVMKKCNIYLWCNKEQIYDYLDFFTKKHGYNFEMLVWSKQNVPPFVNGHYLKDKEYCLYFWEQGVQLHISYKTGHTVFEENVNISDKELYGHPTIKPLDIIENFILNSSVEGGVILDTFLGSGTTAVACKKCGRHYIGFEISPEYYQTAVDRLNGISQIERKKIEDGYTPLF